MKEDLEHEDMCLMAKEEDDDVISHTFNSMCSTSRTETINPTASFLKTMKDFNVVKKEKYKLKDENI